MVEFDDDDFSDLYADVEVQASLALNALHRLTDKPPGSDKNFNNASQGDVKNGDGFSGAEIAKDNDGFYEHVAGGEDERGGLTKLPPGDGDVCDGDDGNKQRLIGSCSNTDSSVEFGAVNMNGYKGTKGTEKNLKYDSLDYEKRRRVDKGNDRDLCFRRADEDNRPIFGRNRGKNAFERDSSHTHVYKSVQISDSDSAEDSIQVVSECDSDRAPKRIKTSDYKNRRNTSSVSNTETSSMGAESSSQSEGTHHDLSSSRSLSPYASLSDDYVYKSPTRSKPLLSKNPSYEKPFRKDLYQRKKYSDTPNWRTCPINENVSYASDVRWREISNFNSNEKGFWRDGRYMSGRRNTLKKCRETDYESLEDERYHNRRRHVMGNSDHLWKVPKHPSAVGTRVARFCNRGDYEKYRRFLPHCDENRYQVDRRYDRNIAYDRREMESSEIGKRRRGSNYLDSSYELRYSVTCGVRERDMRCLWEKTDIENGHHVQRRNYQKSTKAYVVNGNMTGHQDQDRFVTRRHLQQFKTLHDQDRFVTRRHLQQFKTLHSRDDVYKHGHHPEGQSRHFERIYRNHVAVDDDRHAFGRFAELIDEREVSRHRFITMRGDHRNRFDEFRKFIEPRYRDSFDPCTNITEGRKCTQQRMPDAANDTYYVRHDDDIMEWNDNQRRKHFEDSDDFETGKAIATNDRTCHNTVGVNWKNKCLDIEEGRATTEEIDEDPFKCGTAYEDVNSNGIEGLGEGKIREIMSKMERRRARFKEPVKSIRDFVMISDKLLDLDVEADQKGTLERPKRKRRWF